jgi:hypothetical protein
MSTIYSRRLLIATYISSLTSPSPLTTLGESVSSCRQKCHPTACQLRPVTSTHISRPIMSYVSLTHHPADRSGTARMKTAFHFPLSPHSGPPGAHSNSPQPRQSPLSIPHHPQTCGTSQSHLRHISEVRCLFGSLRQENAARGNGLLPPSGLRHEFGADRRRDDSSNAHLSPAFSRMFHLKATMTFTRPWVLLGVWLACKSRGQDQGRRHVTQP